MRTASLCVNAIGERTFLGTSKGNGLQRRKTDSLRPKAIYLSSRAMDNQIVSNTSIRRLATRWFANGPG